MVVHIQNEDISYDAKLSKSNISHFRVKYSNSVPKCSSLIFVIDTSCLKYSLKCYWMALNFYRTCLETHNRAIYSYSRWFCLVFIVPAKLRVDFRVKIGHYRNAFLYNRCYKTIGKVLRTRKIIRYRATATLQWLQTVSNEGVTKPKGISYNFDKAWGYTPNDRLVLLWRNINIWYYTFSGISIKWNLSHHIPLWFKCTNLLR